MVFSPSFRQKDQVKEKTPEALGKPRGKGYF
jgi:hypothetical protein